MRDQQRDAVAAVLAQAIDHRRFGHRVERGRRFVENLNRRRAEIETAEREPLPLAAGELPAARKQPSEHRVVTLGQIVDDLDRAGFLTGALYLRGLMQFVGAAQPDVLARRHLILAVVLKDDAHLALYAARAEASGIQSVQENAARVGSNNRVTSLTTVVLPAPFSPTSASAWPRLTVNETSDSTSRSVKRISEADVARTRLSRSARATLRLHRGCGTAARGTRTDSACRAGSRRCL